MSSTPAKCSRKWIALIPTFSPQGDGNRAETISVQALGVLQVDPYLFPARGRKLEKLLRALVWNAQC